MKGRSGWSGVRRWRVGATNATRGRGLFVLRRAIGTKEAAGGGGCLAGHLLLSATGSTSWRILRAARNTHSALTGFLAAPQRGQNGIEGN